MYANDYRTEVTDFAYRKEAHGWKYKICVQSLIGVISNLSPDINSDNFLV